MVFLFNEKGLTKARRYLKENHVNRWKRVQFDDPHVIIMEAIDAYRRNHQTK